MPWLPRTDVAESSQDNHNYLQWKQDRVLELVKRVKVPTNSSTTSAQLAETLRDPWILSGKYALGWAYFGIVVLCCATLYRLYNFWGDKIRIAQHKEKLLRYAREAPPTYEQYESMTAQTAGSSRFPPLQNGLQTSKSYRSTVHFFPSDRSFYSPTFRHQASISSIGLINNMIAMQRFVFYRPSFRLRQSSFTSLGNLTMITAGLVFCLLYCLVPQPLFFSTMAFGSPPLAIRAGMLSISLVPWIIALSSKVNIFAYLTGISVERLMTFHSWTAYICIVLALLHAIPLWWQSAHDPVGFHYYKEYFFQQYSIFTTGIAALVPLLFLTVHSLPILRRKAYELFVLLHIPIAWASIGLLFWHCNNYVTSWAYLYSTVILLGLSLIGRLFYVNWSNPMSNSFAIGEDAAITILAEGAIKVTIPTKRSWKPGQFVYLRIPGIAILDHHPFAIASLCSDEYQSQYGEGYRNMNLVFRPRRGFTHNVLRTALQKGSRKTYRAFVEGPYGNMRRQLSSFDQIIFFAGGSGMAAVSPHLLSLVKRMRDGKAVTTTIHVVWAMKRPEIISWFGRELGYCKEFSLPESVHCKFYITTSNQHQLVPVRETAVPIQDETEHMNVKDVTTMPNLVVKRVSKSMEAFGLEPEQEEYITALPQPHLTLPKFAANPTIYFPPPPPPSGKRKKRTTQHQTSTLSAVYAESNNSTDVFLPMPQSARLRNDFSAIPDASMQDFDFQFDYRRSTVSTNNASTHTPTLPEPVPHSKLDTLPLSSRRNANLSIDVENANRAYNAPTQLPPTDLPQNRPRGPYDGWRTEYCRPDVAGILRLLSNDFGSRTCVFVCGPPTMRVEVAHAVAALQRTVWRNKSRDELFLHTENWAL